MDGAADITVKRPGSMASRHTQRDMEPDSCRPSEPVTMTFHLEHGNLVEVK
jgi:hypothetical protein